MKILNDTMEMKSANNDGLIDVFALVDQTKDYVGCVLCLGGPRRGIH